MCVVDGCATPPVKVQLVRLDKPRLLKDFCRPHYVEYCRANGTLQRVEVVADVVIVSADGSEVGKGGFAELNTEETDVRLLVEDLGFVKPAPAVAKAEGKAKG